MAFGNLCDAEIEEMGRGRRVLESTELMFDNAFVKPTQGL